MRRVDSPQRCLLFCNAPEKASPEAEKCLRLLFLFTGSQRTKFQMPEKIWGSFFRDPRERDYCSPSNSRRRRRRMRNLACRTAVEVNPNSAATCTAGCCRTAVR